MPSCESYVRMGNLAPYPDSLWFWEQIGLDRDAMLLVAGKLLKESGQASEAHNVAVRRLVGPRQTDPKSDPKYLHSDSVPIPGAVGYCVVEAAAYDPIHHMNAGAPVDRKPLYSENAGYEPIDQPGTVIFLDTSSNDSADLQPFWDRVVLIQTMPDPPTMLFPGLRIGRLRCLSGGGVGEYTQWTAWLCPPDSPKLQFSDNVSPEKIGFGPFGSWIIAGTADKYRLKSHPHSDHFDFELVRERAKEELRLNKGSVILGRVIHWK